MGILASQDAKESDFIDGTIEKKSYRKRWVNHVSKIPGHPFNKGIHMDTHHLISAEAVKLSKRGDDLVEKGYNINLLSNLVGFPATLPGACQLHCQLHRGDHTFSRPAEEPYHDYVASKLNDPDMRMKIKSCYGKTKKREKEIEIHKILDPLSNKILKKINSVKKGRYFSLPLTKISHYFISGGPGCCGQHDVNNAVEHVNETCDNDRLHFKSNERDGKDKRYVNSNVRGNSKIITYKGTTWVPKVGQ
ncbi:AHH domain-containing protein [Vibrio sp. AK197]